MRKILIILFISCLDATIIIDTPIKELNVTIYRDTKLNAAFDPVNAFQTTCHPSSLFIESDVQT